MYTWGYITNLFARCYYIALAPLLDSSIETSEKSAATGETTAHSLLASVLALVRRLAEDPRVQEDDDLLGEWGFSSLLLGQLLVL